MTTIYDKPTEAKKAALTTIFTQEFLFMQWLSQIDCICEKLNNEYDMFYRQAFEVKIYEFLTTGRSYVNIMLSRLTYKKNNFSLNTYAKEQQYEIIQQAINKMIDTFSDSEFYYLAYRRHCASHIFQSSYDIIQFEKDGTPKEKLKVKIGVIKKDGNKEDIDLDDMMKYQEKVLLTYSNGELLKGDEKFGISIYKRIEPIFTKMFTEICKIKP